MRRPYLSRPIEELERLFEAKSGDHTVVGALLAELLLRKTDRSRKLLERILASRAEAHGSAGATRRVGDNVVQLSLTLGSPAKEKGLRVAEGTLPQDQTGTEQADSHAQNTEARRIAENFATLRAKLLQLSRKTRC